MKILVVTPYFHPHLGGSEQYIASLYKALIALDTSISVDVLTYGFGQFASKECVDGITIYRVSGFEVLKNQFAIPNYFQLFKLLRQLKKNNYDVINAHTRFFESSWWTPLFARWCGAKALLTDHCASHPQHSSWVVRFVCMCLDHILIPWFNGQYDCVTVVCDATRVFLQHHGLTLPVTVIPNSVYRWTAEPKSADKVVVSFVGRDVYTKGAHLFASAMKKIVNCYPHVIVKRIVDVDHSTALTMLKSSAIVVHPSFHHEGLPTTILEAGMSGCAVIATDNGGTKEVIKDRETGILIAPTEQSIYQAVETLVQNPLLRISLGKTLKRVIEQGYTWDQTVQAYRTFLHTLQ